MADNKQYITQKQDNGSVQISEDVIISIAAHAAGEVDGVVSLSAKPGTDIVEMLGKKSWNKGIKLTISANNTLTIDCNIVISYGHSVVEIAQAVQNAITGAVESMSGVKVTAVNVNVNGIVRQ